MDKIILIGAGGHCKVIIDIIKSTRDFKIVGITDASTHEEQILGIPIIGNDDILEDLYYQGIKNAFVCIGALNNISVRDKIYYKLKKIGFEIPKLIHRDAIVSPYSKISNGTCVMAGAIINAGAIIGENCIINTGSIIEHDCFIDRNTHISPGASLAGGCKVGYNSHIGIGSTVIQGTEIGDNVIIGAGTVVLHDIEDNVTAVGVPSKTIKRR
ncbi:acetyltransferase [Clostridium botulinum]|uniref:acetyltransferase n=1 Tax=Clostridium botulinum TaxID=1491 RepID=UPI00052BB902|nr:acetyltransferase [Clostridium botulinum]KGM97332.1 serine acetyltransferase [Clostridium botulinum D str. CCUG 7971]KOC46963.1 serine acetyltransferase [Clostridium botulinum]MCD3349941.1 acetyltransferase [Clostridium botulinum D/C]MCD3359059.1 acetyltransferase [Clostridium botulinum D/C]MCD3362587.1 acetyltransferase [Clostridium botulinum D/C]